MTLVLYDIAEGREVVAHLIFTVHPVIDGYESHVQLWKSDFRIHSNFQIIPSKAGHILDDHGFDVPGLNVSQHFLKAGAVEICPTVAVI